MKKSSLVILALLALQLPLSAQQMTLKQCVEYALQNNSNVKVAEYNAVIAAKQVTQQIGSGLPQIDGSAAIKDNLEIPVTSIGDMSIKMGKQYTSSAGVSLSQKILDPLFWVGLKAVKLSEQYYSQTQQQTNEATAYNVSALYYQAVIIKKQIVILDSVFLASGKTLASAELRYKNGLIRKTDLDKIKVNYNNVRTQVEQIHLAYDQLLNMLKFQIGMPVSDSIAVTDEFLEENIDAADILHNEDYLENRVDYQLSLTNLELMKTNKLQYISAYFPSLSFGAYYGYQYMSDAFNQFDPSAKWSKNAYIQVSLNVPIFSGFSRASKVSQAQVNVDIAKERLKYTEQAIRVDVSNYEIQYRNALDNIQNEKENLDLAENVYKDTQLAFKEGSQSSLDLVQAEASLLTAQNNYFNKLLSLYTARLDLEKSKGSLMNFINNQK